MLASAGGKSFEIGRGPYNYLHFSYRRKIGSRHQDPLGSNWSQVGPNMAQLKLDAFVSNFGPSWDANSKGGHGRPTRNAKNMRFHWHFPFFCWARWRLRFGSVWAQLVPKLPLNWPKLRHVGPDLDHMCIKRRRNLRPNPPVGPKFGPSLEPSGPSWAEVWRELGPSRRMLAQLKTMYGQVWRWFGLGSSRPGV